MSMHPHELYIGDVFFSPLLLDAVLGFGAAWLTGRLLNRFRLSRYFYRPPLVLIALAVIYTGFFSIFLLPG
jgi:Protein of unknown function (DUF1656)